ncbi:uncharacterized protein LOC117069109 [Trachypithecus francoisi]|uniref:uncharacterized protein LOC117069109 n=1 Tax=Trachypithecus francoisi TaxID=54180 RepID=UPI00141BC620|nr:uncharacterized protein LOC117069109 [Trachypithecus francoisi]
MAQTRAPLSSGEGGTSSLPHAPGWRFWPASSPCLPRSRWAKGAGAQPGSLSRVPEFLWVRQIGDRTGVRGEGWRQRKSRSFHKLILCLSSPSPPCITLRRSQASLGPIHMLQSKSGPLDLESEMDAWLLCARALLDGGVTAGKTLGGLGAGRWSGAEFRFSSHPTSHRRGVTVSALSWKDGPCFRPKPTKRTTRGSFILSEAKKTDEGPERVGWAARPLLVPPPLLPLLGPRHSPVTASPAPAVGPEAGSGCGDGHCAPTVGTLACDLGGTSVLSQVDERLPRSGAHALAESDAGKAPSLRALVLDAPARPAPRSRLSLSLSLSPSRPPPHPSGHPLPPSALIPVTALLGPLSRLPPLGMRCWP